MFALIIASEAPSVIAYADEAKAISDGKAWSKKNGDNPSWQVRELETVTVIWGDTSDEPGVFHFSQVKLSELADNQAPAEFARLKHYAETYDDEMRDGRTVQECCEMSYTLVATLPGILFDM